MTALQLEPLAGSEASLLVALRRGDESAYRHLVLHYGGRMLAVARRLMGNDDDARDALQDAFLQAFRALPRFQGQASLGTWLYRIVVNAALMRLRRRRAVLEESIEPLLPGFVADRLAMSLATQAPEGADRLLERRERRDLVRRLIDHLPHNYRTVLVLRDLAELDTAEVAARLGVTANAVKVRLHRARQALRKLVGEGKPWRALAAPGLVSVAGTSSAVSR